MSSKIAVIPARAGSKSIINKNLQKVGTKNLVEHALHAAFNADIFDEIVLTTDIPDLIEEYSGHQDVTVIPRPDILCTDEAPMSEVVKDVILRLQCINSDWIWLLQPTTPFRKNEDFEAIDLKTESGYPKSIISVKDIGPNHPNRTYTIKNNCLRPLSFTNFKNKQELMSVYIRNGAFYVVQAGEFLRAMSFFLWPCQPYIMEEDRSVNIDGPNDLFLARSIWERIPRHGNQ